MKFLLTPILLGKFWGIPLKVSPLVVLMVIALVVMAGDEMGREGAEYVLSRLGLLTVSLLVHEYGHAFMARYLGIRVIDITIWPLGGMARLESLHQKPQTEAPIALAGPASNLLLALVFWPIPAPWALDAMWMNLILGAGNLLPAFPMDGGRVLRAWFARASPLSDATRAAHQIAKWLALLLFVLSFVNGFPFLGLVLGIYIWLFSAREMGTVVIQTYQFPTLTTGEVIRRAWQHTLQGAPTSSAKSAEHENEFVDVDWQEDSETQGPGDLRDLEGFRGSLSEYFRLRRKRKP